MMGGLLRGVRLGKDSGSRSGSEREIIQMWLLQNRIARNSQEDLWQRRVVNGVVEFG